MLDAGRHPLIDVVTMAEVVDCQGEPGNFRVKVHQNPRFVREDLCVACGSCVEACPQVIGNEFDVGLKSRKAVYRPFPQSVPAAYVIDRDPCINDHVLVDRIRKMAKVRDRRHGRASDTEADKSEVPAGAFGCLNDQLLACNRCVEACEPGAIDFDMSPKEWWIDAGAILVATGFQEFDARKLGNYGYGRLPDVITSLELERMLNATGVTLGHVVRPSDMQTPKRIVFIQCVGARGEGGRPYCSRFCCMNAVKDSMLIRQHDPEVEDITILYTDIRAFGKGFDDFVERSKKEATALYIRGRPAKVSMSPTEEGVLEVFVEDTIGHELKRIPADLVVLSVAAAPNDGAIELAHTLGIEVDNNGFIKRLDPAISAVDSTRPGIFVCGSAVGPQVIPDCVAQASAVASRAQRYLTGHRIEIKERDVKQRDMSGPPRVGVLVCHCGINIAGLLDIDDLVEYAKTIPDVVFAADHQFACSSTGQEELVELIEEHVLNRIVVAACTPRTHEPVFRETCAQIGMNPYLMEMVNIRDQCSWVHVKHPEEAQAKARNLIRMGVARARNLQPLMEGDVAMTQTALVIGGGIAGIQAATDLGFKGFPVTLVEKNTELGGRLKSPNLKYLYPNLRPAKEVLEAKLKLLAESGARVLTETEVENITGYVGNFEVTLKGVDEKLEVGAIILAVGADLYDPGDEYRYNELPNVITSQEFEELFIKHDKSFEINGKKPKTASFILCVGSREKDGFTGCSRYCCPTAIKQAIELSAQGIDSTIFYRDIRTISTGAEEMYREARGKGVLFIRIPPDERPVVKGEKEAEWVESFDELLNRRLEVPSDLVVLGVGMCARQPETHDFHDMLKASLGLDGFFMERHPELAPVETAVEGLFLAGTIQGPKDIVDTVAQASAAAAKAATYLAHERVKLDPTVAVVNQEKCRGCGKCAEICLFQAPKLVPLEDGTFVAEINASLCKGCGTCGSWCPSGAIISSHFTDDQINAMIDAFFIK